MVELLTIPMSHYCEKVRWALELFDVSYRERAHLQVFHGPVARFYSGGTLVPVLLTPEGPITDSTRINRYLDEPHGVLYPPGVIDEIGFLRHHACRLRAFALLSPAPDFGRVLKFRALSGSEVHLEPSVRR